MSWAGSATRLFVDLQVTQSTSYSERGMPRYAAEFASALLESGAPIAAFALNPSLPPPSRLPGAIRDSGLVVWNTIDAFRQLSEPGPLTVLLTCPFFEQHPVESVLPRHVLIGGGPIAAVLYDLIPYVMPRGYQQTAAERKLYRIRQELVRRADVLLALSEHTRRDALDILGVSPERVHTIGAGASEFFRRPTEGEDPAGIVHAALPDVHRRVVLGVGGPDPRKNWPALVEAFSLLPRRLRQRSQLVLVSNLASPEPIRRRAGELGLSDDELVITSLVTDDVLRALYQSADLLVLPSLYEGFGLPVLEAARCGCVALTSNVSSLPEVLEYEPATFDPDDPGAIAAVMQRALEDPAFRRSLRAAGDRAARRHTWTGVAERSEAALGVMTDTRRARPLRQRIAIVGRSSRQSGLVAGAPRGVLDALSSTVDLDCFEDTVAPHRSDPLPRRWRAFPIEAFGSTFVPEAYDTVIYMIDDVALAGPVVSRFLRMPGVAYLRADPKLSADIVWSAGGLLLPSEAARQGVAAIMDGGVGAPCAVLPLPAPAVRELRVLADPPTIAVLGSLRSEADAIRIVDALALVRTAVPARVAFVGPSDPDVRRAVMRKARDVGVARAVLFTGSVTPDEYPTRIETATCAVCLASGWSGGGSFSVLNALAAGVPVLTDRTDAAELPSAGVVGLAGRAGPDELAEMLRSLLSPDERQRLSAAAYQYAAAWSAPAYAAQLLEMIEQLSNDSCDLITVAG